MDYSNFFGAALNRLHEERRYRVFADLERIAAWSPDLLFGITGAYLLLRTPT